ncbi:MAG: type II toxin-antitoxin system YafQ family toxin [Cytophagaceae bacterium]|jgi:mRNA interferase YafQ|nr:type II toxin-antitoxin system YafQ family toxin [Cytophagaceae bacterium]
MYTVDYTNRFKRQAKLLQKRGYNMDLLNDAIKMLMNTGALPVQYKPHKLSGNYAGCWECHIKPDWLMIWEQNDSELILLFLNTGTHSDLF